MKLDFKPGKHHAVREGYVVPTFGGDDQGPMAPELQNRLRRPMVVGAVVIGVFVFGLGLWASADKLATGITAIGEVRAKLTAWCSELNPPGLALGPMAPTWNDYFDHYLEGKMISGPPGNKGPKTKATATNKATPTV